MDDRDGCYCAHPIRVSDPIGHSSRVYDTHNDDILLRIYLHFRLAPMLTSNTEDKVFAIYQHKHDQLEPLLEQIPMASYLRCPYPPRVRDKIEKLWTHDFASRQVPPANHLREPYRTTVGEALALLASVGYCGFTHARTDESALNWDRKTSNKLEKALLAIWPRVWSWVLWFHENVTSRPVPEDAEPSQLAVAARGHIQRTILVYTIHGPALLAFIIKEAPTILPILTSNHLCDPKDAAFASAMQEILNRVDKTTRLDFAQRVVDAACSSEGAKDGAQRLSTKLVTQIHYYIALPKPWDYGMVTSVITLFILLKALMVNDSIRDALIGARVIPATLKLVYLFTEPENASGHDQEIAWAVRKCIGYLRIVQTSMQDSTWVQQALKAKLIPALLRSVRATRDEVDSQHALWMLEVFLPQLLVLRSALEMIEKSCETAEMRELAGDKEGLGLLWEPWRRFLSMKERRMRELRVYDEDPSLGEVKCLNGQCQVRAHVKDMKPCTKCRRALYCSPECQKTDRPSHQNVCKDYLAFSRTPSFSRLSREDVAFVSYLVKADILLKQESIRSEILAHYQKIQHEEDLIIVVDYCQFPHKIGFEPFCHGHNYDGSIIDYRGLLQLTTNESTPTESIIVKMKAKAEGKTKPPAKTKEEKAGKRFVVRACVQNGRHVKFVLTCVELELEENGKN